MGFREGKGFSALCVLAIAFRGGYVDTFRGCVPNARPAWRPEQDLRLPLPALTTYALGSRVWGLGIRTLTNPGVQCLAGTVYSIYCLMNSIQYLLQRSIYSDTVTDNVHMFFIFVFVVVKVQYLAKGQEAAR